MGNLTAPDAVLYAAVIGGVVSLVNLVQKYANDRRTAWWTRAEWAIDHTLSKEVVEQRIGQTALRVLIETPGTTPRDYDVVDAALEQLEERLMDVGVDTGEQRVEDAS